MRQSYTVMVVDPDPRVRADLEELLSADNVTVLQAESGENAFRALQERPVDLVLTELYLKTGDADCLIEAIRGAKQLRATRTLAHTHHATSADRKWAMRVGADGYLIKPTRAERLRYVVARLASTQKSTSRRKRPDGAPLLRRDSLEHALDELEPLSAAASVTTQAAAIGATTIVFGRDWWDQLTRAQRADFRRRAKRAHVNLRSDSDIGDHYVEVRGPARTEQALSTERPESPYRR